MELRTINEVIPTMKTGSGLFSAFDNPMWSDLFTASSLDIFFAGTYGQKYISPYTDLFVSEDGKISSEDLTSFASAIYEIRATEWSRLLNDLMSEYNPIENTDVTETVAEMRSGSGTNGNTRTLNTTTTTGNTRTLNTRTDVANAGTATTEATSATNSSENTTTSGSNDETVFGFDSVTAVGKGGNTSANTSAVQRADNTTNESTASTTSSSYTTDTGTVGDSGSSADTGTITDSGTNSSSETLSKTFNKHGNIGIQTAVDMLSADTAFWKWSFVKAICEDICEIIALDVY